jgi:hypothetical protein
MKAGELVRAIPCPFEVNFPHMFVYMWQRGIGQLPEEIII